MLRLIAISFSLMLLSHPAFASPRADAEYITNGLFTDDLIETARATYKDRIVHSYEQPLADLNLSINDPDRFAELLPDALVDDQILAFRERVVALYLREFTPEQLAGIAEFQRTTAWQKLVNLWSGQFNAVVSEDVSERVRQSVIDLDASTLAEFMSSDEIAVYQNFFETDAGKAFRAQSFSVGLGVGFSLLAPVIGPVEDAPHINTPYILEIIETDDIIRAPNRIWRKDIVDRIRAELE